MSILWICQYNVTNPDLYAKYNPGSLETIMKTLGDVGGNAIAAGPPAQSAGDARHVGVVLQFPDKDALDKWLDHPEYAEAKAIREAATDNYSVFTLDAMA